jgi:hypothetical protein
MTDITILQIDDRSSYREDKHYPEWIFLASVLRWSVIGNVVAPVPEADRIVGQNSSALDSIAAFLADRIESGQIPIFSTHARILLGGVEKCAVINKLRGLDGGSVGGLVGDAGLNYYLGGRQLFKEVMSASLPVDDDFEKGGVWHRLAWDAPKEWSALLPTSVHPDEKIEPPETATEYRARLAGRHKELKKSGCRNPTQKVAEENNISTSRVRWLIREDSENKRLAATQGQGIVGQLARMCSPKR